MDNLQDPVSRAEFHEFKERVKTEFESKQSQINDTKSLVSAVHEMSVNVERISINVEGIAEEQKNQGERLSALENRDGEKWRNAMGYVATACIGFVLSFLFNIIIKYLGL